MESQSPRREQLAVDGGARRYDYIDCVRGYAILLVITCHLTYSVPELPYPIHRITVFGWHGVQLFFLASCVTLLMSWNNEVRRFGAADARAFFVRRFFRIAPAYYLAAALYYFVSPPAGGFDALQLLTTLAFVNAWHPLLMPTEMSRWLVVPGGWSIGVEFTFYFLFPVIAVAITSLRRALLFLAVTLCVGAILNSVTSATLAARYSDAAVDNFIYFWFPNQFPVFALGSVVYFLIVMMGRPEFAAARRRVAANSTHCVVVSVAVVIGLAYVRLPHWLTLDPPYVPVFILVSLAFAGFIFALSFAERGIFVNRPVQWMGKVSFSAYLLHYIVISTVTGRLSHVLMLDATGYRAILAFALLWVVTVLSVFIVSYVTYRAIELPMISYGHAIARRLTLGRASAKPGRAPI